MTRGIAGLAAFLAAAAPAFAETDFAMQRREMVERIREVARAAGAETGRPEIGARVLDAMAEVPRHEFVPKAQVRSAYRDRALGIGEGQTISQPFIVALMTDLLDVRPGDKVLEVGTGSGYQAAVLDRLGAGVYTIEIVEPLAMAAKKTFERLGLTGIETRTGDGYQGWPEHAPYDSIIVTAAPDHVPQALVSQLKPGGRLVIPVGAADQDLMVVEKGSDGEVATRTVSAVKFVPFTRAKERR